MTDDIRELTIENEKIRPEWPVVFFANGLGDTVLALPALRALVKLFPRRLTLISDKGVYPALLSELAFRRVIETEMIRNVPDWTREFAVSAVVQKVDKCDFFISLVPWYSRSLNDLLLALKPPISLGFFEDFAVQMPLDFTRHAADLAFDLVKTLDGTLCLEDYAAALVPNARSRLAAQSIRQMLPSTFRTLVIHADTGRPKMWSTHRFIETIDSFLSTHEDFSVLLVGTVPQNLDTGRHAERVIPCYGLPLGVSMGLVSMADIFLGVDSCMLHVADLSGIPGVGLFGASNPVEFGFRFSTASIVITGTSMEDISVSSVCHALNIIASGVQHAGAKVSVRGLIESVESVTDREENDLDGQNLL